MAHMRGFGGLRGVLGALVAAAVASCGNSSNKGNAGEDASEDSSGAGSPLGSSGGLGLPPVNATCGPIAMLTQSLGLPAEVGAAGDASTGCPMGQACCTPMLSISSLTSGVTTTCIPASEGPGGCSGGTFNQCMTPMDCTSGQVCCSGTPTPEGGTAASGSAGLLGGGVIFPQTACQTSCMPGQQQICAANTDCLSGQTCQASAGLSGLGATMLGGLGGYDATVLAGDAATLAGPMYCGTSPPAPDAGPPGSDASPEAGGRASSGSSSGSSSDSGGTG
jgi:hypothetical protein